MKKVIITVLLILIILTIGGIIYVDKTNDARKQEYEQSQSTEERFDFSKLEDYMNSTTEENKSNKTSDKKKKKSTKKKNTDTKDKTNDKEENTVTVADENKKNPSTTPSSNKTPSATKPSSQTQPGTQAPSTTQATTQARTTEARTTETRTTEAPTPTPTCSHNWVEVTTKVHHDAVYRDDVIHHDAVTEHREVCVVCGAYAVGGKSPSCSQEGGKCGEGSIPQVVTIKKAYDEKTKVLVTEAYDEEVGTGEYKCSICGAIK